MKKQYALYVARLMMLIVVLASPTAFATTLLTTVSKNKVVKNEVFQLRVVVDKKVPSDSLDLQELEKDFYVGRPSFGSSMNIINGDRTTRSEWTITLAPQRLGYATIPAFTIDGASSLPITIQVSTDPYEPNITDLIEVQSSLSKTELYPHESATLSTKLIVKSDPRRLQNPKITPPKVTGLSLSALGEPKQYQSVIDGLEVTIVDQNYRVTADNAGEFELSGIGFQGSVVYRDDQTGATKLVSANTPAKQFKVRVKPIPDGYQSAWLPASSLSVSQTWLDSNGDVIDSALIHNTRVGESITREIHLEIEGLATERFPDLHIDYPSSVRVYQDAPKFTQLDNGKIRMTLKQVLIAEQQGDIALNNVALNWWDSTSKSSKLATLSGLDLKVAEGSALNHEPLGPSIAPEQSPQQVVTVYQAGFWPYLTALFVALWLITLLLWLKSRKSPANEVNAPKPSSTVDLLLQALKSDDKIKASFLLKSWLEESGHLRPELRDEIEQQFSEMQRSQYSHSGQSWKANKLIALIKQAEKSRNSTQRQESALAHL